MKLTVDQVQKALEDKEFRNKLPSDVKVLTEKYLGGCGCGYGDQWFKLIKRVNKEFKDLLNEYYKE